MNKHAAIIFFIIVFWGSLTSQSYGACDYYLYKPLIFADGKVEGCINKRELDSLLNRKVLIGAPPSESAAYEFLKRDDERIRVENCNEYIEARAAGFSAFTTFDITMDSFFIRTCTVLAGLKESSPPKKDYMNIKNYPELDKFPVLLLPVSIQSEADELMSASKEGRSFMDYIKSGEIKIKKSEKSFTIIYGDTDKSFELIAKSDFNYDGYADMLIFTASHSSSGSWRAYGYILISAREEGQKMYDVSTGFDGCRYDKSDYSCSDEYKWNPLE